MGDLCNVDEMTPTQEAYKAGDGIEHRNRDGKEKTALSAQMISPGTRQSIPLGRGGLPEEIPDRLCCGLDICNEPPYHRNVPHGSDTNRSEKRCHTLVLSYNSAVRNPTLAHNDPFFMRLEKTDGNAHQQGKRSSVGRPCEGLQFQSPRRGGSTCSGVTGKLEGRAVYRRKVRDTMLPEAKSDVDNLR